MKVVICFPLTLPSMGEWSHSCCDVGNCQYLLFLIISFGYCKRVIVALLHQLHIVVEEIYTSVACGCFGDNYLSIQCFFFQLADCCFSCTMIPQLFSHLLQGYYQLWIVFITLLMVFLPFGLVWTRCLSLNFRLRLLLWWKEPDLPMFS